MNYGNRKNELKMNFPNDQAYISKMVEDFINMVKVVPYIKTNQIHLETLSVT